MPRECVEAWVLRAGKARGNEPGELERKLVELPELGDEDVLAEPLFGCWEGNMAAALDRWPVDICRLRHEEQVVLGNAGVMRVLRTGAAMSTCQEGDIALIVPIATTDRYGYTLRVLGYDAPNRLGLLAKRVVLHRSEVLPLRPSTRFRLEQWAGFPIRYTTAWESWFISFRLWQSQFESLPATYVWGWGGGVAYAELQLAREAGCHVAMCASKAERFEVLKAQGITPVDRRDFEALDFDEEKFGSDRRYRAGYLTAEGRFLERVKELTAGEGVSIFIDNIGAPVFRATLRALGRLGIVTTAGWKHGKLMRYDRAVACVQRHTLLHTHGCKRSSGVEAVEYAERTGWLPPVPERVYQWDEIPQVAEDFRRDQVNSYFPVFAINPV